MKNKHFFSLKKSFKLKIVRTANQSVKVLFISMKLFPKIIDSNRIYFKAKQFSQVLQESVNLK